PVEKTSRALDDYIENGLHVSRRLADDAQDIASGVLAVQRLNQLAVACPELLLRLRLVPERLLQPLLQVADPGVFALPRLGRRRTLGFDLRFRGLRASTHRPLLTSQTSDDRAGGDDRLCERARLDKADDGR